MNIVVTGGSRGLGFEIVRQQAELGHNVYVISRKPSDQLEQLTKQHPDRLRFIAHDLKEIQSMKKVLADNQLGLDIPIHGLVCNAGMAYDELVTNADADALVEMFEVNVFSSILLTKLVIRNMLLHQTPGAIVFVSSISARKGFKGLSMYAATKGALESFSRGVAREWGTKGIRSNCVVPGFMETEMSAALSDEQRGRIFSRTSLGKRTEISHVAATVGYLLSTDSGSMTGQEVVVDCGTI